MQEKYNKKIGGLKELPKDERDFQLGALIDWPKLSELPEEFIVEPLSIKDQMADGNDDFCGACAGAGMIEPKEGVELFYPFLFAAAKHESYQDPNSFGLNLRDVGNGLTEWGIPEVTNVTTQVMNMKPEYRRRFALYPETLKELAKKHKAQSYFFINGPYDHYDNARAAEWYFRGKKQHIIFGVKFGWRLTDFYLDGFPNGTGHAMWMAGWFSNGLRAVNSAGMEAGRNGIHCMSRQTFNRYAEKYGIVMVTDMPKEQAKHHHENNIKIGRNRLCEWFRKLLLWV